MNTQLLNQFLLAAATEPWEQWWHGTRLVFADFAETECGELDKAQVLRTMECVIADEWETRELCWIIGWEITAASQNKLPALARAEMKGQRSPWDVSVAIAPGIVYQQWPEEGYVVRIDRIRISCDIAGQDEVSYTVHARERGGNRTDGDWHGTLSLDRAQWRCRRRVMDLFPNHFLPVSAIAHTWQHDSPRWVPFHHPLREGLVASWQTRERVPQDDWPEISGR